MFFMQAGFAMLEVGIVQPKNATNILFKNLIDASLAAITWWLVGYGVAFGTDNGNDFIGTNNYAFDRKCQWQAPCCWSQPLCTMPLLSVPADLQQPVSSVLGMPLLPGPAALRQARCADARSLSLLACVYRGRTCDVVSG